MSPIPEEQSPKDTKERNLLHVTPWEYPLLLRDEDLRNIRAGELIAKQLMSIQDPYELPNGVVEHMWLSPVEIRNLAMALVFHERARRS